MTVIRKRDIARRMREVLRSARDARREITLQAKRPDDASCLEASGAIRLVIRDRSFCLEIDHVSDSSHDMTDAKFTALVDRKVVILDDADTL